VKKKKENYGTLGYRLFSSTPGFSFDRFCCGLMLCGVSLHTIFELCKLTPTRRINKE